MKYPFDNKTPIYLQIVDIITKDITSGVLKKGQKLLSVREYALLYQVNPNTICKALSILEDNKIIYTERTNGKFVTNDVQIINEYKNIIIKEKIQTFMDDLSEMGLSKEEVLELIKEN